MEHNINTDILKQNMSLFRELGGIQFPLKTNSTNEMVLEVFKELASIERDNGFLVSTLKQADKVIGLSKYMQVEMINTLESVNAYLEYFRLGVRKFVFADNEKLKRFLKNIPSSKYPELCIKVKINNDDTIANLVNTAADDKEYRAILETINENKLNSGLSIYIPKSVQTDVTYIENCIMKLSKKAKQEINSIKYSEISLGGISEIIKNVDRDWIYAAIIELKEVCKRQQIKFNVEPGMGLMRNAVTTDCEVLAIARDNTKYCITIEGSTYDEFWDMKVLGRRLEILDFCGITQLDNTNQPTQKILLYGDSGDGIDLITELEIPKVEILAEIKVGDRVVIGDTGYYFGKQE